MSSFIFHFGEIYIRWWDIVDILIVSYLLYRAALLTKGTLAMQILVGLTVLLILFLGAGKYELVTLHSILLQFWQGWMLLIIVLFQPEIRRILSQLGPRLGALFGNKPLKLVPT